MASCIGNKIKITVDDGLYTGTLQAIDDQYGRVTIKEVTNLKTGTQLKGLLHFFSKEIHEIVIVEEKRPVKVKQNDTSGSKILSDKLSLPHLEKLKDVQREKLFLSGNSSGDEKDSYKGVANGHRSPGHGQSEDETNTKKAPPPTIGPYTVIDQFDQSFEDAVHHLKQHNIIGVSAKAINIGRTGQLCWLALNSWQSTFLFDIISLGAKSFTKGLAELLTSQSIMKVIHDCRSLSDILQHHYELKIVNVFDTQVAEAFIHQSDNGYWPSYVSSLHLNLFTHLRLHTALVHVPRFREGMEDDKVWSHRPSSIECLDALAKDVMFLRDLRRVMLERMLRSFTTGVDIYLSSVRDASDKDAESLRKMPHRLPKEFRTVQTFKSDNTSKRDPKLFDENGFYMNCYGTMDPEVQFSNDGVWHRGDGTVPHSYTMANKDNRLSRSRSRGRERSDNKDGGRCQSRGRSDDEAKVMDIGAIELANQKPKVKSKSPIPAYREEPDDDFLQLTDHAMSSPEAKIQPVVSNKASDINLIASGCESKVGLPKLSDRKSRPMRKCVNSGNELDSGGEFDIITSQVVNHDKPLIQGRLPHSTKSQESDSSIPNTQVSPASGVSRGKYLLNIEQSIRPGGQKSPGGLQSRLPKAATDGKNDGGRIGTDLNGGITLGRGHLRHS